jgi:hypothetical protein
VKYNVFVGYSDLPINRNRPRIFPTAVHFSGVSFFWRAPQKMKEVPWGITANIFVRRGNTRFDLAYSKTGGGEDIDYCLQLTNFKPMRCVPNASILHPWWNGGNRDYNHFYNWSFSDGILQSKFPHLTYRVCPDPVETSFIIHFLSTIIVILYSFVFTRSGNVDNLFFAGDMIILNVFAFISILAIDIVWDLYKFCVIETEAESYATGLFRVICVMESTFIKNYSSFGHLVGHLSRGQPYYICSRFDWFCGTCNVVAGEKAKASQRFASYVAVVGALLYLCKYKLFRSHENNL